MKRFGPAAFALSLVLSAVACAVGPSPRGELARAGGEALKAGDYASAEANFAEALSYDPDDPELLLSLGVIYQNTGRDAMARKIYERLIEDERTEAAAKLLELRESASPAAVDLARRNLGDLERIEATPLPAPQGEETAASPWGGLGEPEFRRIYADLDAMYATLGRMNERLDRYKLALDKVAAAEGLGDLNLADRAAATAPLVLAPSEPAPQAAPPAAPSPSPQGGIPEAAAPAATVAAVPAPAAGEGLALKIHIASFRSRERAEKGWEILKAQNPDLLGNLKPDIKEIDLGPGTGVFYRLRGGSIATEAEAKALCAKFKARNLYCSVAYF